MSPLYDILMSQQAGMIPRNPMANFMQQLNQFRQTFQGDPRQKIQELLNSGQVSQQQYNWAIQQTNQIFQMMNQPRAHG